MKKEAILAGALALSGCSITVPYFEDLDPKYVCGGKPSPYCQPTSSVQYSKIKNGLDYDGDPSHYLGRSFTSFFERNKCVDADITENDVVISENNRGQTTFFPKREVKTWSVPYFALFRESPVLGKIGDGASK